MIFTAITGQRDAPRDDIKCFTGDGGVMEAKKYKILSHKYIDSDISVWLDGNIELLIPEEELIKEFLGDADIGLFKHPYRDCIYYEAVADAGRVEELKPQVDYYRSKGFPKHAGLYECGVLVRRNTEAVNKFNEEWWKEIVKWSARDQISFPYVLSKYPLKVKANDGNVRNHKWFRFKPHN
jgi:hypothetical protein